MFAAVLALPGDAATAILGKEATPDRVAALRDQLHLNDSVISQYFQWLGGLLSGDLGTSAATQEPVSDLLSARGQLGVPGPGRVARASAVAVDRVDGDAS